MDSSILGTLAEGVRLAEGTTGVIDNEWTERWTELRSLMLEVAHKVCVEDLPAVRSRREALDYCLALRSALSVGQGFNAREFDDIELETLGRRLRLKEMRAAFVTAAGYVRRAQWYHAYDEINSLLLSSIARGRAS